MPRSLVAVLQASLKKNEAAGKSRLGPKRAAESPAAAEAPAAKKKQAKAK